MRIRRIAIGITLLCAMTLAVIWLLLKFAPQVTLKFTQAQLQSHLEHGFPTKKCLLSACVELTSPSISLTEGSDRIVIETAFVATLGSRTMPGTTTFTGRPHYEASAGKFYLLDVQVAEFNMIGNAPDFNEVVKVRGPGIVAAIMNRFPLYSVQSHPQYGAIVKLALKSVSVVNGHLQVVFSNPLLLFTGT